MQMTATDITDPILATYLMLASLNDRLLRTGVTLPQAACLEALSNGPLTMGGLGAELLHANSTITAMADLLEKRGFIQRQRSAEDRRTILLHITDTGRKVLARARAAFAKATG